MPQNVPFQAQVSGAGPASKLTKFGADAQGAQLIGQRHGKYYEEAYGGGMFGGANPSAVALTVALATTYVGLCLSNPAGSTVNLVLKRVRGVMIVAPAAEDAFGLIVGWSAAGIVTHTTPLTPVNHFLGAATANGSKVAPAGQGLLDSACTLVGTPAWDRWFASMPTAATFLSFGEDIEDGIVIPPGGYAAIGSLIAGGAAGFLGSMDWAEIAP